MTINIECNPITGRIFVGTTTRPFAWTGERTDLTEEAVDAVIRHLRVKAKDADGHIKIEGEFSDGTKYILRYEEASE